MKEVEAYKAKSTGSIMLNANELYQSFSEDVMREIQEAIVNIPFHRYPDETSRELILAYSKVMNVSADQILAGNGSDEMLGLMIGYFLGKDKKLYTLSPDFSMYDYYATMHEAEIMKFSCEEDGSFDICDFIEYGRAQKVHMILFSNPNNPTGHMVEKNALCKIVEAFPNIPVVIDEAYGEFAEATMLDMISIYPNLYVTRTLSKGFGLAGARLGFLISNANNIATLKPNMVPYNISSITQKVGTIVLGHAHEFQQIIKEIKEQRDAMYQQVQGFRNLTFYPSSANYLYGRTPYKQELMNAFEKEDIKIRDYQKDQTFRITIGSSEENAKVLDILTKFDKEECRV